MTAVAIYLSYSTPKRVLAYVGMRFCMVYGKVEERGRE